MDAKTLAAAAGIPLARAQKWVEPINEAIKYADITLPRSIASFIAQTGHESLGFSVVKEMGSDKYLSKYDTGRLAERLGNSPEADGDGQLYAGRGLIQVTGRANYLACSKALFGDDRLLRQPELLEQPKYAALSAAWFWKLNNLNALADADRFTDMTRKINGGTNGLADRKERYNLALSVVR